MAKKANYVRFDIALPPVGHETDRGFYGFMRQKRDITPLSFKGGIGELEGCGEYFGELLQENYPILTLGEQAALFNAYLAGRQGLWEPKQDQWEYLDSLFGNNGDGNILHTLVDYDHGNKSWHASDGYRRVLLIDKPELIVVEDGEIKVKGGERKPKLWPADGYLGRTCDGAYDPDGVPFQTWPERPQAEQTWLDAGADPGLARDAVSYSLAREEGKGIAIVCRTSFEVDEGPFNLYAGGNILGGGGVFGRIPVIRH